MYADSPPFFGLIFKSSLYPNNTINPPLTDPTSPSPPTSSSFCDSIPTPFPHLLNNSSYFHHPIWAFNEDGTDPFHFKSFLSLWNGPQFSSSSNLLKFLWFRTKPISSSISSVIHSSFSSLIIWIFIWKSVTDPFHFKSSFFGMGLNSPPQVYMETPDWRQICHVLLTLPCST